MFDTHEEDKDAMYDGAHNYVSSLEMRLSPDRDKVSNEENIVSESPFSFGEGTDYSGQTSR